MTQVVNTAEEARAAINAMHDVFVECADGSKVLAPCMNTLLVARSLVVANTYNPNSVSGDKMNLLKTSIVSNGWCFPDVVIWDDESEQFVIVDGFHRSVIAGDDWLGMKHIPVVVLKHDITQRMAATVQFNKARGVHQIDLDADVIRALIEQGLTDEEVSERLGIDLETVHRYKQLTGVAELFGRTPYSTAWEMTDGPVE